MAKEGLLQRLDRLHPHAGRRGCLGEVTDDLSASRPIAGRRSTTPKPRCAGCADPRRVPHRREPDRDREARPRAAITAFQVELQLTRTRAQSGNPGFSSSVPQQSCRCRARGSTSETISPTDPPCLDFHGTKDPLVPSPGLGGEHGERRSKPHAGPALLPHDLRGDRATFRLAPRMSVRIYHRVFDQERATSSTSSSTPPHADQ